MTTRAQSALRIGVEFAALWKIVRQITERRPASFCCVGGFERTTISEFSYQISIGNHF